MNLKPWLRQLGQLLRRPTTRARNLHNRCWSPTLPGHALKFAEFIVSSAVETLEDRALMSRDPLAVDAVVINESGENSVGTPPRVEAIQFIDSSRWSATFTDGSGLTQGDATTLRWGIVPEGTAISGAIVGESASGSDLIQFMDSLYGDNGVADDGDLTQKPWFTIFSSALDRLAQISGLTYTYLTINSQSAGFVSITDGSTSSATIPEILIGGHSIDGMGNPNTLAYSYSPDIGDLVIDTDNIEFFGDSTGSSIGMRNMLMHESGHGVGLYHVESSDGDFLMEPFISTTFDGPQFDDILAFQRGYGDVLEKNGGNNTFSTATSLGAISSGGSVSQGTSAGSSTVIAAAATDFTSIDDETDLDFFRFSVASTGTATLTLTPTGPTYQQGSQDGVETSFNAAAQNDLTLQLLSTNGSTVLQTANVNGLGGTETISNASLSAAGTYFARVSGNTTDAIQLYRLDVTFSAAATTISANDAGGNGAGNGTDDAFRLVRNGANLEVYLGNNLSKRLTFSAITSLVVQGSSDNDTLTLDFSGGDVIPSEGIVYTGGTGRNTLMASGAGNVSTGSYAPSSTTNGSGTLTLGGKTVTFSGLTPLIASGMTNFTFTTPNGDDSLTIDSPGAGQNRISGTSGGVGFESLTLSTITNFTLNASANDDGTPSDSVTLNESGLVATGLTSFTLTSAAGGSGTTLNGPVSLSGNLSVTSGTITANSTIATSGSGTVTLTANGGASLNVNHTITSSSGAIALSAAGDVIFAAAGDVASTSGHVTVTADHDGNASGTIHSFADVNHGSAGSTWSLAGSDGVLGGVISGAGGLTKIGAGTLTLDVTSANTFTGTTTVNAGRLIVLGSLASGSAVTVQNTAALGGTGTVAGTVNVQSGGKVAPGTSPGILNTGSVSFSSGSTFQVEIGGTTPGNLATNHDQLQVTGMVDLGGATLTTSAFNRFVPVAGNKFTILVNDGSDLITGTFNGLAEGATISNFLGSDLEATITYVANTDAGSVGNDVVLTTVARITPTLSINDVMMTEGHSGTTTFTFNVTLSAATAASFRVPFQTLDGTATTANHDFVPIHSSSGLKIGAFNATRGGTFGLANAASGANSEAMRAGILAAFPDATIVGVGVGGLTPAFLATVNVVWLNSMAGNSNSIPPLSAAEQTALQNFVNSGGGAILFGENSDFDDTTLLSPFGLETTGTTLGVTSGLIANTTHPLTHGPFGNVTMISSNSPGNLTGLGNAASLGTWNNSGLSALAVLNYGAGKVVALTDASLYADRLNQAGNQNRELLLNALAFAQPAGDLQFAGTAGETHILQVTVHGDGQLEPQENFSVLLTGITGSNDVTILDGSGAGTIQNDDVILVLQIDDVLISERTGKSNNAVFNVTLSSPSTQPVTVNFSTARVASGPSATAGKDFQAKTGMLRFAPGQLSQTISVLVLDDTLHESDESFFLQLSSASGATIADGVGQATIRDNDAGPKLTINDVTVTEKDTTTVTATLTVKLSAASAVPVTVDFATAADSATEGTDYQETHGSITFNPSETTKTITVVTNGDLLHEANEVFFVNLTNSMQAAILDGQGKGTIKNNDQAPRLSIGDVTVIEGATAVFTVSLSTPSGQAVRVNYATANGTAVAGREFAATNGTLTFAAGETTKTIRVAITANAISSSSKSFKLSLSQAVNALLSDSQALATILDSGH